MDWKRRLIYKYNENYDKSSYPYVYADCGDISEFGNIDKEEFAKYVSLFDSELSYNYCDDGFIDCPATRITLAHIFVTNNLCFVTNCPNKIKMNLFVGYIKNIFIKLLILCDRTNYVVHMARKIIDRKFSECLICDYKDYVGCNKIFVCRECVKVCSYTFGEIGFYFLKSKQNSCCVGYTGFGTINFKDVVDNAHKLIGRCKYVDWSSVVLFVMARDELGLLMDVVRVIVGFVYC